MYGIKSLCREFLTKSHITVASIYIFLALTLLVDRVFNAFVDDDIFPFWTLAFVIPFLVGTLLHAHWSWYYTKMNHKKIWYQNKSLLLQYAVSALFALGFYLYCLNVITIDSAILCFLAASTVSMVMAIYYLRQLKRIVLYAITVAVDFAIVYQVVKTHAEYESY